jgi:hypothetical protein
MRLQALKARPRRPSGKSHEAGASGRLGLLLRSAGLRSWSEFHRHPTDAPRLILSACYSNITVKVSPMWPLQIDGSVIELSWYYFPLVVFYGIGIRLFISLLREYELRWSATYDFDEEEKPRPPTLPEVWWRSWFQGFLSTHESALVRDWWLPFIVGLLELAAYPYFIAKGDWKVIGGWIALKTASQWGQWSKSRSHYQRFLIGNALVIAASVFLATELHIRPVHRAGAPFLLERGALNLFPSLRGR